MPLPGAEQPRPPPRRHTAFLRGFRWLQLVAPPANRPAGKSGRLPSGLSALFRAETARSVLALRQTAWLSLSVPRPGVDRPGAAQLDSAPRGGAGHPQRPRPVLSCVVLTGRLTESARLQLPEYTEKSNCTPCHLKGDFVLRNFRRVVQVGNASSDWLALAPLVNVLGSRKR